MRKGRNIKHLKSDITRVIDDASIRLGNEVKEQVRIKTPRDEGNAQKGWHPNAETKITKPNWRIFNNVEYIGALNEGHSRQAPAKYIQKTIRKAIKDTKV